MPLTIKLPFKHQLCINTEMLRDVSKQLWADFGPQNSREIEEAIWLLVVIGVVASMCFFG